MKKTETLKKYRAMKENELRAEYKSLRKEELLVALKVGAGKADDYSQISKLRKNIAQVKTLIRQKEIGADNE